jgi:cobaltochelatase CobS
MAQYKLKEDFSGLKKGFVFTALDHKKDMVITKVQQRKYMIPKLMVEAIGAKQVFKKTGSGKASPGISGAGFTTTMSPDDASKLATSMGATHIGVDPAAPAADPPPPPKPKLKKDEFFMSDMTGGELPTSGRDHIMKRNPDKTWEKHMLDDIPKVDKHYVWNPDVLEAMWLAYKYDKKILLVGFPGTGKTSGARQFAAWVRHPILRFNGKDGIDQSSFLGYAWVTNASTEWKDGSMVQGAKMGYIVLIDEVMKIPSGIQMALQSLYEENGHIVLDEKPGTHKDKMVIPAPTFRMILTDNSKGTGDNLSLFPSTQMQDTSTLDRYQVTANVPYMPQGKEVDMLMGKYPGLSHSVVYDLVTFANMVRTGYAKEEISLTLSPRGLETVCQFFGDVPDTKRCLQMVYLDKLSNPVEIEAVERMYSATF